MTGGGALREPPNFKLGQEIRTVCTHPHPNCLPGILSMDPRSPKFPGLSRHAGRMMKSINSNVTYYSANITRPDVSPWINVLEYAQLFQSLWSNKHVALVCEEKKCSIFRLVSRSAAKVTLIKCPHREAYQFIDKLFDSVVRAKPDIAVISAGPTATCLAHRLSRLAIQAIDIGSAGGFLLELLERAE